jgi:hypothetical protein
MERNTAKPSSRIYLLPAIREERWSMSDKRLPTFIVQHDPRDIIVSFDDAAREVVRNTLKIPPSKYFIKSLDQVRERFYPHVSPDDCPWQIHKAVADDYQEKLKDAIQKVTSGDNNDNNNELLSLFHKDLNAVYSSHSNEDRYQKLGELEKKLGQKDSASLSSLKTAFSKYLRKNEVQLTSWPIAWYWKSLFTGLPKWEKEHPDQNTVKIRVSHIRQWVLAVMYTEQITKCSAINLFVPERILLRPPLFGRSDRYIAWDQYFTLCRFQSEVSREWIKVSRKYGRKRDKISSAGGESLGSRIASRRLKEERCYVLGRHDLIYTLRPFEPVNKEDTTRARVQVKLEIDLHPFAAEKWEVAKQAVELGLENRPRVTKATATKRALNPGQWAIRYPYDYVSIPVSQRSRGQQNPNLDETPPPKGPKLPEEKILLSSDSMCRAYEALSEIWNDRTAKSVLIIAPPGSGKELLSKSIHHFQEFPGPYIVYALSPSQHERNDRVLFARDIQSVFNTRFSSFTDLRDVCIETTKWIETGKEPTWKQKRKDPQNGALKHDTSTPHTTISDGLLFQARRGAILLDEIDKVPEQTRASLLRLLESNEFALYDTSMVVCLDKWRPLYIFSGSMPRGEMFELAPRDFWTRISHVVEVGHPLDLDDAQERMRVAKSYFTFFWMQHLPKFFKKGGLLPFEYKKKKKEPQYYYFHNYYAGLFAFLRDSAVVDVMASIFAEEIESGAAATQFSIRNIRGAAGRAIYGMVDYFLYDKTAHESVLSQIRSAIGTNDGHGHIGWFELLGKLLTGALPDSHSIYAKIEPRHGEQLRDRTRQVLRSAIRTVYR